MSRFWEIIQGNLKEIMHMPVRKGLSILRLSLFGVQVEIGQRVAGFCHRPREGLRGHVQELGHKRRH